MSEPRGVYRLSMNHVDGIRSLCEEPDLACLFGVTGSLSSEEIAALIERRLQDRAAGIAYEFVCTLSGAVLGYGGLLDAVTDAPRVVVGVASGHRRQGHGTFTVERLLELAFDNLQRGRVVAHGNDVAASGFLTSMGFSRIDGGFALTRQQWQEARHRSALRALHPSLASILAAELAAGNEVAESRIGWPEPDSVFIRLRREFLADHKELPVGVRLAKLNDPHWWAAEYSSENPRHIIASR
jgi:GNAT superfamily N-acetyltransferase